jgi:DNA polymerase-3 subunit delta
LRTYFEKDKKFVCVAFYPDTEQTLFKLAYNFLKEKEIPISTSNLNLIVGKCNSDREQLINELIKIEYYCKTGKKITSESISKLTNLNENHDVSELVNNCLIKNKKRVIHILNENIFSNEDCILITRTFLNKSKKILNLSNEYEINKNIELTISSSKPPVFWKDKEITKQQLYIWTTKDIKNLIYKISELELLLKKNINNSINLVNDFILDQAST